MNLTETLSALNPGFSEDMLLDFYSKHIACFADSAKTKDPLARPPPPNITLMLRPPQIVWTSPITQCY